MHSGGVAQACGQHEADEQAHQHGDEQTGGVEADDLGAGVAHQQVGNQGGDAGGEHHGIAGTGELLLLDQVIQDHAREGEPDIQHGDAPGAEAHGQQERQRGDIVGIALQDDKQAQADEAHQTHVQEGGSVAAQVEVIGGDLAGLAHDLPQAGEGVGPVGHQEGRDDKAGADEAHEQLQEAALVHVFDFVHLLHL